jgi:hypothetical protein
MLSNPPLNSDFPGQPTLTLLRACPDGDGTETVHSTAGFRQRSPAYGVGRALAASSGVGSPRTILLTAPWISLAARLGRASPSPQHCYGLEPLKPGKSKLLLGQAMWRACAAMSGSSASQGDQPVQQTSPPRYEGPPANSTKLHSALMKSCGLRGWSPTYGNAHRFEDDRCPTVCLHIPQCDKTHPTEVTTLAEYK